MMIEEDQKIWEIIEVVLDGNPTSQENQILEDWLLADEKNRKTFETLKRIRLKEKIDSREIKQNAFVKIQSSILNEGITRKLHLWRFSAVASIIILLGLGIAFFYLEVSESASMAYIETKSPLGVKTKVILADGTYVYLSPGTSLKYPAVFKQQKREVILDGEAYFEVSKDAKHPFIVHTTHIDVRVFGTHFNVKAYKDDKKFVTTLMEGSVGIYNKLAKDNKKLMKLKPNQQAIYSLESGKIELHDVNAKLYSGWKDDRYYFENETFSSITKDIERNFNVIIKINYKALRDEKFSGLLDKKKSVYQLLDGMAQYGNFDYKLNNDTIVIQER